MTNTQRTFVPTLLLAGTLVAGSAAAQQPGHQGMGAMGGMMPGMEEHMGQMAAIQAYDPASLLRESDLALTKDQVAKLETLAAETKSAKDKAMATHDAHHSQLVALFQGPAPDPAQVSEHGRAAMAAMAEAHGTELAAFAKAKGLLTPEQRVKVDAAAMHGMHMGGAEKH